MPDPSPFDWLEDKPRRKGGWARSLVIVTALAGGAWWLGAASPWAGAVQAQWADSAPGRQVAAWQADWNASPPGRLVGGVWSLGASGQRLAALAPADTRFYAEAAPSWWTRLALYGWRMAPDTSRDPAFAELRAWVREQGLDWDQDLAPWIQPDVGMLGRASGPVSGAVDQWSVWVGSGNDAAARAFIAKLRDRRAALGETAREGQHGRTAYAVLTPPDSPSYALAVLGGYVVAASPATAIVPLIDQVERGGPTLAADNPRYRRVAGAWTRGAVGHAFWDAGATTTPEGRRRAGALLGAEAVGASMSGGGDWLTIDVTTAFEWPDAAPEARERWSQVLPPLDMRRFEALPDATVLAVGGTANRETHAWLAGPLSVVWAPLGGALGDGAVFTSLLSGLTTMQGPFAVGLVASSPTATAEDPVGAVLALRPDDPDALELELTRSARAIAHAGDTAKLGGAVADWARLPWLRHVMPKGTELTEEAHGRDTWQVLRAGGQGLAGWKRTNGDLVVAGGGEALRLCQADRFESLTRAAAFDRVRKRLPGDPALFVYGDGQNVVHLIQASPWLPARYAGQAQRALEPLRAIGFAAGSGIDAEGFHHAAFTILSEP
ncbi:MAG: DUF3352 domain-containing protein [Candidatus Sericytochromatia bacterium]